MRESTAECFRRCKANDKQEAKLSPLGGWVGSTDSAAWAAGL